MDAGRMLPRLSRLPGLVHMRILRAKVRWKPHSFGAEIRNNSGMMRHFWGHDVRYDADISGIYIYIYICGYIYIWIYHDISGEVITTDISGWKHKTWCLGLGGIIPSLRNRPDLGCHLHHPIWWCSKSIRQDIDQPLYTVWVTKKHCICLSTYILYPDRQICIYIYIHTYIYIYIYTYTKHLKPLGHQHISNTPSDFGLHNPAAVWLPAGTRTAKMGTCEKLCWEMGKSAFTCWTLEAPQRCMYIYICICVNMYIYI